MFGWLMEAMVDELEQIMRYEGRMTNVLLLYPYLYFLGLRHIFSRFSFLSFNNI
jgi:hypothetical protein